jgi:hypothetical protein
VTGREDRGTDNLTSGRERRDERDAHQPTRQPAAPAHDRRNERVVSSDDAAIPPPRAPHSIFPGAGRRAKPVARVRPAFTTLYMTGREPRPHPGRSENRGNNGTHCSPDAFSAPRDGAESDSELVKVGGVCMMAILEPAGSRIPMREVLLRTLQGQADAGEEAAVGVIRKT